MKNLIIKIGDTKIIWFDTFFKNPVKKIAVKISGGTDSSLLLWMMCNFIDISKQYDIELYPYHGRDLSKINVNTSKGVREIINFVSNQFPDVKIHELSLKTYRSVSIDGQKRTEHDVYDYGDNAFSWPDILEQQMRNNYNIDLFINGRSMNLTHEEADFYNLNSGQYSYQNYRDFRRDPHRILTGKDTFVDVEKHSPFYNCNKFAIAEMYKMYNLMETLYPMTVSCVALEETNPCKQCVWCKEKYVAFGSYDFGLQ